MTSLPLPAPSAPRRASRHLIVGLLRKIGLFIIWNLLSVGVLLLPVPALVMAAMELAIVAAFVWIHLRRRASPAEGRRRAELRLRMPPRRAWRTAALWIAATLVLDQLVTVVYFHLVPHAADYPDPLERLERLRFGWLPLLATAVVAAPLMEEVAFRGWVQRPLERRLGAAPAIALAAFLFALAHGLPLLIPYFFVAGLVLGATAYLSRSLWVAVLAHAAHNLSSVVTDRVGFTNEAAIAWARRPGAFAAAVVGLVLWGALLGLLARRLRGAARARLHGSQTDRVAADLPLGRS